VPAYGPQNDVTLKMPAFEWVHVQLHQQKGMISLSPPTICNSANWSAFRKADTSEISAPLADFCIAPEALFIVSPKPTFKKMKR
ncbi:hypothetical protein, partial [Escherichia coli]|uniref:hypothetical protein n=1 Tax=Escherichia coli TaxID=562 RepID=UPI003AF3CE90